MKRFVAFDLDGTLIDTPRAIVETFSAALSSMDAPAPDAAAMRATIGLPLERAFGGFLGCAPEDDRAADGVRRYREFFKELVLPHARRLIFPGVVAGLDDLRREGFILAIATSKILASADALLEAAGIRDRFGLLVCADQVARPKPDPESAREIARRLGLPCRDAVMVGDTTHDVLMARAAGMRSIAVTYGVHGLEALKTSEPTWIADSFEDVVKRVKESRHDFAVH